MITAIPVERVMNGFHYNMVFTDHAALVEIFEEFGFNFSGTDLDGSFSRYPHFTRNELEALVKAIQDKGGMFVHVHPKHVGDYHKSVCNPDYTYRVDLISDRGVVFSENVSCEETAWFAIDADNVKFYRVEVWDTTLNSRLVIGNPIWNCK